MNHKGILVVVSGFSGSGKGTLMNRLMEKYDNYALSVSATTRSPRAGECDGREYFFKTQEEFKEMIQEDAFIEYARYVDNYYGTPKKYVQEQLDSGRDVILEIEMQGALKVKEKMPETLLIFVTPPSVQELKRRLQGRGTESGEIIDARMAQAKEEVKFMEFYDHVLVNETNQEESCVDEMHQVIQCAHTKTSQNREFIEHIREQLKEV
ncbi:guanylate kinase [Ruminococcus gauvreauii]|uniref:Guanylate kinase n=1 Tax=Ruminococcus gauvreauii TaxID=438033 RepID=A0ABY5VJ21_9FIRM|nr:guanylate kinase [Ruminococcus gauvreauii]UWP59538.1 guanylate kinase [Ruminococcus gauvreauii]